MLIALFTGPISMYRVDSSSYFISPMHSSIAHWRTYEMTGRVYTYSTLYKNHQMKSCTYGRE